MPPGFVVAVFGPPAAREGSVRSHDTRPAVADHELLRCIGRGSYGEVWLGRNVLGEFRAIKIVYRHTFEEQRPTTANCFLEQRSD